MRRHILKALAVAGLCAVPAVASAATNGFATANVNMRSGPSTRYPAVVVIPVGAPIVINGCLNTVNWCDVTFARGRGWVSGNYIQATFRQNRVYVAPNYYRSLGIPTITFDVDTYWGRYYRDRDFYRERDRWRSWDYRRDLPPPPPPGWSDRRPEPDWNRDRDRYRYEDRNRYDNGDRRDPRWDNREPERRDPRWDNRQGENRPGESERPRPMPQPQVEEADPGRQFRGGFRGCTPGNPCEIPGN
ncbi:SH3 domain-containing protein [Rhizobium lemnae]|uniref:SH3 domain-containing protein n=1 Tax=Rhizobium lemnae TaxID=1214924 RepID=A0ABV8EG60_9HYPH|nr:SH3 domain-containing protein [Rhizobium lemnae]